MLSRATALTRGFRYVAWAFEMLTNGEARLTLGNQVESPWRWRSRRTVHEGTGNHVCFEFVLEEECKRRTSDVFFHVPAGCV